MFFGLKKALPECRKDLPLLQLLHCLVFLLSKRNIMQESVILAEARLGVRPASHARLFVQIVANVDDVHPRADTRCRIDWHCRGDMENFSRKLLAPCARLFF